MHTLPVNTSCDDGINCTIGDYCDGNGTCLSGVLSEACYINTVCYASGTHNPLNFCSVNFFRLLKSQFRFAARLPRKPPGLVYLANRVMMASLVPTTIFVPQVRA